MHWKYLWSRLRQLFWMKLRFAMTGAVATGVDYTVYLLLVDKVFSPVASNLISYPCGVVVNFLLHKRFVFELRGKPWRAFALSVLVSAGGLGLSTLLIYGLSQLDFFAAHQPVTKLVSAGVVFFYNFYLKRLVFEGRLV